ncbi:hypothetical protein WDW89_08595 [Deltaproteobacteria bacterium TL4]
MLEPSYIESIKQEQPLLWQSILSAADQGLILIDHENDAISATNRLLLTYPGLHEVLAYLNDQWVESHLNQLSRLSELLAVKN